MRASSALDGQRVDLALSKLFPDYSRSYFQHLLEKKLVLRAGIPLKKRERIAADDELHVEFLPPPEMRLDAEDIPLEILYEDEEMIAVHKPVGMVVHPAPGHRSGTFVNALLHHCKLESDDELRPGIVHRLDRDTSGVLIAAKTRRMHEKLVDLFSNREIKKCYLAICIGNVPEQSIDAPIARHPKKRQEMAILEGGREAITHVKTVEKRGEISLVEARPVTGRTHQIRVHLRSIQAPILGDLTYGSKGHNERYKESHQLLHCHSLEFVHPFTKNTIKISADWKLLDKYFDSL